MKTKQQGFTLIELITVIVILGILSAFALPRFAAIETQARIAALNGIAGSLRSSAALAHSLQLAEGKATGGSVTMEGAAITLTNGFPNAATIQNTISDLSGFTVTAAATATVFTKTGSNSTTNCKVTYTQSASANVSPVTSTVLTNC